MKIPGLRWISEFGRCNLTPCVGFWSWRGPCRWTTFGSHASTLSLSVVFGHFSFQDFYTTQSIRSFIIISHMYLALCMLCIYEWTYGLIRSFISSRNRRHPSTNDSFTNRKQLFLCVVIHPLLTLNFLFHNCFITPSLPSSNSWLASDGSNLKN